MFASRLPAQIEPSPLARLIARKREEGLLDLTESNPTRAGIVYPEEAILAGFQDRRALVYDPESLGLPAARAFVADLHGVGADRVMLTASTSEAYSWLFKLLCDPGDEVLVPQPSYPLFELLAKLESVTVRHYPLRYHEGWFIDVDALRGAINERTRAIVVVNPNNPTGHFVKPEERVWLEELAARHGLALISDEVFANPGHGASLIQNREALTFTLNGLSKMVGMPQMKLGWMVLSGPAEQQAAAYARLELIADTYLSVGTPVQYALPALLGARELVQGQIRERLEANLAWLRATLAGSTAESTASLLDVEGGWYAILRVPQTWSEEEWVRRLLEEQAVLVQPGYFYDFATEAYLVLSLLTPPSTFREGVRRMKSTLR